MSGYKNGPKAKCHECGKTYQMLSPHQKWCGPKCRRLGDIKRCKQRRENLKRGRASRVGCNTPEGMPEGWVPSLEEIAQQCRKIREANLQRMRDSLE